MTATIDSALAGRYDGRRGDDIALRLALPLVVAFDRVGSTLDIAHALAGEGADAGSLVLADAQTAGRGRLGRAWQSEAGAGLWLALIERPRDVAALDVLSLRIGLALATSLAPFADSPVRLKWPNDVYLDDRKLAGVLVEVRWRDGDPEWACIGVGINVRPPVGEIRGSGLRSGVVRLSVLESVLPALRGAAACSGELTDAELTQFAAIDLAAGRRCTEPVDGTVCGIDSTGALVVLPAGSGSPVAIRAGSLVMAEDA